MCGFFFFTETKGFWWVHSNCCQQQRSSPFRSQKVKGISLGKLCGNMGHASKYPRYLFVIDLVITFLLLYWTCSDFNYWFYWIYRMLEPYMYWYIIIGFFIKELNIYISYLRRLNGEQITHQIDPKILDLKFFAINYYVVNKNY